MAHTITWDETIPDGTDDPRDGDDRIRDFKTAMRERLRLGGIHWETSSPSLDNDAGKIAAGVQATGLLTLYETDLTTAMIQFDDGAAVSPKVTIGDGLAGSNPYELEVDQITDGVCTGRGRTVAAGPTTVSATSYTALITATLATGNNPGPVLICFAATAILSAGTADGFDFRIQVDRNGTTTYTTNLATIEDIEATATTERHLVNYTFLDTSGSSNLANTTIGYQIQVQVNSGSNTVDFEDMTLSLVELRA